MNIHIEAAKHPVHSVAGTPSVTPLGPTTATVSDKIGNLPQNKLLTYFTDPIMHIDYDRIRYPKYPDAIFDWELHHNGLPEHNSCIIEYLKQCRKNEEASNFGGPGGPNFVEPRGLHNANNNPLTNSNGSLSLKPLGFLAMSGEHSGISRAQA